MDEKLMKQIVEAVMQELMAQRSRCFGMHGRAGQASGDLVICRQCLRDDMAESTRFS